MKRQNLVSLISSTVFSIVTLTGCGTGTINTISGMENTDSSKGILSVKAEKPVAPEKPAVKPVNGEKPAPKPANAHCENKPAPEAKPAGAPAPKAGTPPQPKPAGAPMPKPSASNAPNANLPAFTVTFSGGYETNPVDHGRPVILIASALGVTAEVFRYAFSFVTPAAGGIEPAPAQVALNKAALLNVLSPYGITNDFLDTVSNFYRYNESAGQVWARTPATATAVVTDGVVTGITITNPGAGYSSVPTVTISGSSIKATAAVAYTKDFATNGSISAITLSN